MNVIEGFFGIGYAAVVIGIVVFFLTMTSRFVQSQERIAGALEEISRRLGRGESEK